MKLRALLNHHSTLNPRAANLLALIFLALLPLVFFWRETLGWLTLGDGDTAFWFFPIYTLVSEELRAGHLPLWNPYLFSGMPLFAQWQAGVLDPLNWIYLLGVTSRTLTMAQEASFAIALLATFAYTRSLGLKRRASIVAAVIYALSGFMVARTIYPGLLHITALMPLVLWFIERLAQRGRWRDVAIGALIVAWQIFAAHPQPLVYSSLLAAGYALFRMRNEETEQSEGAHSPTFRIRLRFLIQCAAMFVLGAALAAVQLIPAWRITRQSVRQQVPYEFFTWHSLHPLTLLTTLFPFFHGQGKTIYQLPYWGNYWHHNEAQIYLGAVALSLAVAGALYAWRARWRAGVFWSVAAVVGVILSFGKYAGPVAWLLYRVPLLGSFRSPNRHWMEVALAMAVLAGYAVDRLLRDEARAVARFTQITAGALAALCALVGAFVLWRRELAENVIRALPDLNNLPRGFLRQVSAEFYLPIIFAACALVVLIVFTHTRHRSRWYVLLLAFLLLDFNLYAAFAPISNEHKLETLIGTAMPPELAAKQNERDPLRYQLMLSPTGGEFSPYWFYGHEMASGYDPLASERYKTFSEIDEAGRSHLLTMLDAQDRTLDLLNVRYVLVSPQFFDQTAAGSERIELGGIAFATDQSSVADLQVGQRVNFTAAGGVGDTLAVVSSLANSSAMADGEEIAEVVISCGPDHRFVTSLRAGRDTAEWAYDRADVRSQIQHSRAMIAESQPGDASASFQSHSYLARIPLPAEIAACSSAKFVQVSSKANGQIALSLKRLAFYDSASHRSVPLVRAVGAELSDTARWREVQVRSSVPEYQNFRVYENLQAMPRVWLAGRAEALVESEQLRLIRGERRDAQGRAFDPLAVVLVEPDTAMKLDQSVLKSSDESLAAAEKESSAGAVSITRREPSSIVIEAEAARSSMLVLSEMVSPGWRVKVDDREAELWRVNYLLRGVALEPGRHMVEFIYRPRSLIVGAAVSATTALVLLVLMIWTRRTL